MPPVRNNDEKVIAILCADIHLSLNPPIWRSAEPDWFAAMKRPLDEMKDLQIEYNCPIICAGDIFDKWNSPPELINFAYDVLPKMYAIPGQHDLPLHKYEDIKKSAYWTLVDTGKVCNLQDIYSVGYNNILDDDIPIVVYAFPFGNKLEPMKGEKDTRIDLAVVHEYCWIKGHSYPKADPEAEFRKTKAKNWNGYDIVMFGDNHKGFQTNMGSTQIFNCGTLMRRNSDEIDYQPQVGLLLESGKVQSYCLDTSKDKHLDIQEQLDIITSLDMKAFIEELEKLGDTDLDFHDAVKQYLKKNKVQEEICNIILRAMGL